jgi:hypothetical protein
VGTKSSARLSTKKDLNKLDMIKDFCDIIYYTFLKP